MYYFAYALDLDRKEMLKRCPGSIPKYPATLHHYQLVFSDWTRLWRGATSTIKPLRGARVLGAIYEVSEDCLRRLEKQLGSEYHPLNVTVNNEDSEPVEAVTYLRHKPGESDQPSPAYLARLQQGYKDWRLI